MGLNPEFEIGGRVRYWAAKEEKNNRHGRVTDIAQGADLCTYEEDTGNEYDEADDACGFEHDHWYYKVKFDGDTEESDWMDEYCLRTETRR